MSFSQIVFQRLRRLRKQQLVTLTSPLASVGRLELQFKRHGNHQGSFSIPVERAREYFRDKLVSALGDNLFCLVNTGSRVRGEAKTDSDYDFTLFVSELDGKVLDSINDALTDYPNVSVYILDKQNLTYFPSAMYLQFVYSNIVYGTFSFPKPSIEDVVSYISIMKREEVDVFRHYLTRPHETDRVMSRIALSLKNAYIVLTYIIYKDTHELPKTKVETIGFYQNRNDKMAVAILQTLKNWSSEAEKIAENPRKYLHLLEQFWRTLEP